MSIAQYSRTGRKPKKPVGQLVLEIIVLGSLAMVVIFTVVEVCKSKVLDLLISALRSDTKFLFILVTNIFIFGGLLLVGIFQWADQERARFRAKQQKYRSMLISKDYYRTIRRVKVDQFMIQVPEDGQRKLDIDHSVRNSSYVEIDYSRMAREARKTNIAYDEQGRLSGRFKTYFSNGNVLVEVGYKNGVLDGPCMAYYPNGLLHNEKNFRLGKLHGIFKAWDEDGSLFFEIEYRDDVQHGFDKSYRRNGIIEYEDIYDHGRLVQRKTFNEMGAFKYLQKFEDDKPAVAS